MFLSVLPAGTVVDTPVVPWLLDVAAAQQSVGQHTAAVASLQKALQYMALPRQQEDGQDASNSSSPQLLQQPQQQQQVASSAGSGGSSSSDVQASDQDAVSAVMGAAGGDMELARLKLSAMVS